MRNWHGQPSIKMDDFDLIYVDIHALEMLKVNKFKLDRLK